MRVAFDSGTLVRVFEHFTQDAQRALVLAQDEARRRGDGSLEPAHLLLGLLRADDGAAATALAAAGVDYERTRGLIGHDGHRAASESSHDALSGSSMQAIERSVQISWARADGAVDTQDLLRALLEQDDETIASVLHGLDVTPEEVVQCIDATAH